MATNFTSFSDLLGGKKILVYAEAWKETSGPALAKVCQFSGVRRDKSAQLSLHLIVADPLWRQELHYQKDELLKRYRDCLSAKGIEQHDLPLTLTLSHKGRG